MRVKVSHFLALVVIAALSVGLLAGPASAKSTRISAKQKAHIRATLRKAVKKNPNVISRKSFLKKAGLVNFRLPITVRLRTGDKPKTAADESATANTNAASIDLGTSLGSREIDLGGSLAGEIVFHDSFDGGALGNVDLDLRPGPKALTSTSIPLLWNSQISDPTTRWDGNALQSNGVPAAFAPAGCGNFYGSANLPFGPGFLPASGGLGLPGFPYVDPAAPVPTSPGGFLPEAPGADSLDKLVATKNVGDNNALGGNPNPFPTPSPTSGNVQDTVLRTNALSLSIATPGTTVTGFVPNNGSNNNPPTPVQNSQNIVIGKSGGQANLFGNIPGKSYGIDVTVSLATRINSIFRIVDQDLLGGSLFTGEHYPAGLFTCRQVWSGGVDNYIPGVRLQGSLKIAPAITSDGKLRIAKATLSSGGQEKANVALAACLVPYQGYDAELNNSDTTNSFVPPATSPQGQVVATSALPADTQVARGAPAANCNAAPTKLVADSALTAGAVTSLLPASTSNGYTATNDGTKAVVSGQLSVTNVVADVLIGDTP